MPAKINIIGRTFTRAFVLEDAPPEFRKNGKPRRRSFCRCSCGVIFIARNEDLLSGNTKSHGCLQSEITALRSTKHGHAKREAMTGEYQSWRDMITRVDNPNIAAASNYSKRGVCACQGLRDFPTFLNILGTRPHGMEIDRFPNNNTGHYSCGNCPECFLNGWPLNVRWATVKQQARNKRTNLVFTVNGITACLAELCERFQVRYGLVIRRLKIGWPIERAIFTQPLRH